MAHDDSLVLVQRAKKGDRKAWEALCERYYSRWQRQLHGELGRNLKQVYETQDLVQSALAEAFQGIDDLRNEAAFFAWVSAIARRKALDKGRKGRRIRPLPLEESVMLARESSGAKSSGTSDDEVVRLLDAVLSSFGAYPETMAAVYLKYFERLKIAEIEKVLGKSTRSVHRLIEEGLHVLRAKLGLS